MEKLIVAFFQGLYEGFLWYFWLIFIIGLLWLSIESINKWVVIAWYWVIEAVSGYPKKPTTNLHQ